jgi:phytoene dehydrogenase-like protein
MWKGELAALEEISRSARFRLYAWGGAECFRSARRGPRAPLDVGRIASTCTGFTAGSWAWQKVQRPAGLGIAVFSGRLMNRAKSDVIVVGGGHNGLVGATLLARRGLKVTLLDEKRMVGGAAKTEFPFSKAPRLGTSTGAYLLGVMPPEVLKIMGANVKLVRRDPHYFLPMLDGRYLLFGSDKEEMRRQFIQFFSEQDWNANQALTTEIGQIRDDLAPSWLEEPLSVEATAEKYIRRNLRRVFLDLVTQPAEKYIERFGFRSEMLIAMYAVTDGFSGLSGSFGTPGTGMNFLVHNMCRLPGSDGTFMIAAGGMGSITQEFARLAREAGVEIHLGARVVEILTRGGAVQGVVLEGGREIQASIVVTNADPFRMRALVGRGRFPEEFNRKLDGLKRMGTTMKVNLALDRLPTFKCLPQNRGQHSATIHLLPQVENVIDHIRKGFEVVQNGRLADFPTIEWYMHTPADPSLQDEVGRHNSAFFVQWVPYELEGTTWEKEQDRYVQHLFQIADEFCPGFTESVVDSHTLTPKGIEEHFGMTYGHIHHIDNTFGFDQRVPYATPISGLYSCSAGTHPAGAVIGAAGHNAANRVLKDLQKRR